MTQDTQLSHKIKIHNTRGWRTMGSCLNYQITTKNKAIVQQYRNTQDKNYEASNGALRVSPNEVREEHQR